MLALPIEKENLKFELIQKVTNCIEPYVSDVLHASNQNLNINECIVVIQTEDGSQIYGDVTCIICQAENRKNQKSKRVYYNTKRKTKGCWVLSNINKHLQQQHMASNQIANENKLNSPITTDDADTMSQLVVSHEEHYTVDSNGDLSVVMTDDSELKKIEDSDHDYQELLYTQLSARIIDVMAAVLKNDETREQMEYVLDKSLRKLMVTIIPGLAPSLISFGCIKSTVKNTHKS